MRLFHTIAGLRCELDRLRQAGQNIGLVPTMGALHAGHGSLIARAVAETDAVVVSIFVNPLQFEPGADLDRYPRTLEADCQICEAAGVAIVFAPTVSELYGSAASNSADLPAQTQVLPPESMLQALCAPRRPGHFAGVTTVVTKLLNIVRPAIAYFGEKDAQQLAIIRRLVADLQLPVTIRGCPTVREASGLALSSRNQYLSEAEKIQATAIFRSLQAAKEAFLGGDRAVPGLLARVRAELEPVLQIEYAELVHPQTLQPLEIVDAAGGLLAIAAYLGKTRLIDNIQLRQRQPIIAIDGPAGAGKSTVTRQLASQLGLLYLDTGAMYRAIAWLVMEAGADLEDEAAIAELATQARLELLPAESPEKPVRVRVNDREVTQAIRTPEVTANVSKVAAQAAVRAELVRRQQEFGDRGGIVAEGRDVGTTVFPQAELKIFLTASPAERARRRQRDLLAQGLGSVDLAQLEQEIRDRDDRDSNRKVSPLRQAADAIVVQTDGMTIEEVIGYLAGLYRDRLGA